MISRQIGADPVDYILPMQKINILIQKYEFNDEALIKEIVLLVPSQDLVERINECFQKESVYDKQGGLIELIQDILCCRNGWVTQRYSNNFRRTLDASSFPNILNQKIITHENRINYHLTSFFKYSNKRYLPILQRAYKHALKYDPLEVSMIVGEMYWLSKEFNWNIIKNLSRSQDFLHRWAILDIFGAISINRDEQYEKKKLGILRQLRNDPNPFIAQEASWLISESRYVQAYNKGMPKSKPATINYKKKMRLYSKAKAEVELSYTFGEIKAKYSRLRKYFPETFAVRNVIEGILMFGWQKSVIDKDYDKWLAVKIKDTI